MAAFARDHRDGDEQQAVVIRQLTLDPLAAALHYVPHDRQSVVRVDEMTLRYIAAVGLPVNTLRTNTNDTVCRLR